MPRYRIIGAPTNTAVLDVEREIDAASVRDAISEFRAHPEYGCCVRFIVHDAENNALHLIDVETEAYTGRRMTSDEDVLGAGTINFDLLRQRFLGGDDMLEDYLRPEIFAPEMTRKPRTSDNFADPARPARDEINRQTRQVKLRIDPDEWTIWNYFIQKSRDHQTGFLRNAVWAYIHGQFPVEADRCLDDVRRFAQKLRKKGPKGL